MAKMPDTIDFDIRVHGLPAGYKLVPIEPPPELASLLTSYSLEERHGWSERDRAEIVEHLRTRWAAILAALPDSLPPVSLGMLGTADVPRRVGWFVFTDGEWRQSSRYADGAMPLYELPAAVGDMGHQTKSAGGALMATSTFGTCAAQLPTLADLQQVENTMRRFRDMESAASWRAIAEWMAAKGFDPESGCVLVLPPAMAPHFPHGAPDWVRVNELAVAVIMMNPRALGLLL